jgi:sugar phosphate isomerase/epimerase
MVELTLAPGAGAEIGSAADLERYLEAVAAGGFSNVSLSVAHIGTDPAGTAQLLARHQLRCPELLSLQVTRHEEPTMEAARRVAQVAAEVGPEFVLAGVWARPTDEVIDRFGRCGDLVAESGARIALEMPPIGDLNSITAALSVVDAVGRGRASLLIDTYHFSRGRSTWGELESVPLDALGYVQFDDALPAISDDVMHETTERRAFPGDGEFELSRFAQTLTGRGWAGLVSIEVLSSELRRLEVREFARRAFETTAPYWGLEAPRSPS